MNAEVFYWVGVLVGGFWGLLIGRLWPLPVIVRREDELLKKG